MSRTINSKYFQHFDLLRGILSFGLGFITGKVSGSDSILTFGSWSRNVKQGLAVSQSLGLTILYPCYAT